MLSENRKFNFIGEITLYRSKVLEKSAQPEDDKVNWLLLNIKESQYSFVYKIKNPSTAKYNEPFLVEIAFTMSELIKKIIVYNEIYHVMRGKEKIGILKIISVQQ